MPAVYFSFSMTSDQREVIGEVAKERGLSLGAFVRNCVRQEVEKTGRTWPRTRLEVASQARVRQHIEKANKIAQKRRDTSIVSMPDLTADGRYDARPKTRKKDNTI